MSVEEAVREFYTMPVRKTDLARAGKEIVRLMAIKGDDPVSIFGTADLEETFYAFCISFQRIFPIDSEPSVECKAAITSKQKHANLAC